MAIYERMTIRGRGGALPTYQRQTGAYAPGAGVSARVSGADARILAAGNEAEGKVLVRLGDTMNRAVQVGVKAYDDYSKSKATQLITQYRRDMNSALYGENGILTQKGEAALDADEQRAERARQLRDSLMKDAGEYTKRYFNILADDYDADTSLKAQQYAGKERVTMMNRNDEAAAEERAENAIASYANETDFNKSLGEALWYMEQRLRRDGYSDEALQRGLKETSSKVFRGAIESALAGNDVASARRLLERGSLMHGEGEGAWSRMTADDVAWGKNAIRTKQEALQAKAESAANKAARENEKKIIQAMSNSFISQIADFPEDEKEGALADLCEGIADEDIRKKVWNSGKAQLTWDKAKYKATTARQVREFQELARSQGWSPAQAEANIDGAANLTDKARETLRDDYNGMKNKETPENRAALAELRRRIDLGPEQADGIDPNDDDAIENYALEYGLTNAQTKAAFSYRDSGGNVGTLKQSTVNAAARMLFPDDKEKAKKISADLYPLVADQLEPGKKATVAQVKTILSLLMTEGHVYRDWNTGGVKLRYSSTYEDALREGKGDDFLVTVPPADSERIADLLRQNGIRVTPERISRYYFDELRKQR